MWYWLGTSTSGSAPLKWRPAFSPETGREWTCKRRWRISSRRLREFSRKKVSGPAVVLGEEHPSIGRHPTGLLTIATRVARHAECPRAAGCEACLEVECGIIVVPHQPLHRRGGTDHARKAGYKRYGRREVGVAPFEPKVLVGDATADQASLFARFL